MTEPLTLWERRPRRDDPGARAPRDMQNAGVGPAAAFGHPSGAASRRGRRSHGRADALNQQVTASLPTDRIGARKEDNRSQEPMR